MNNSLATTAQINELNTSIQAIYDFINTKLKGKLFTFGQNVPGASDQTLPWIRTDAGNNFLGVYTFNSTAQLWVSQHLTPSNSKERRLWTGSESEVWLYDGGDGTDPSVITPTDTTGAMWQVEHAADFRFLIGPGTGASTTISVGQTGGEEKHTLTAEEAGIAPDHTHGIGRISADRHQIAVETGGNLGHNPGVSIGGSGDVTPGTQTDVSAFGATTFQTDIPNTVPPTVGHNTMPPYLGMFVIKRTVRKNYTVVV